jgi:hypothetical protein
LPGGEPIQQDLQVQAKQLMFIEQMAVDSRRIVGVGEQAAQQDQGVA